MRTQPCSLYHITQHNKKREEFQRLKEKYPEVAARMEAKSLAGGADDDDEESSDDEVDATA